MSKGRIKNAKKSRQKPTAISLEAQTLAENVTDNTDAEVLAEVDIDNKAVSDVLIVRDIQADENTDAAIANTKTDELAADKLNAQVDDSEFANEQKNHDKPDTDGSDEQQDFMSNDKQDTEQLSAKIMDGVDDAKKIAATKIEEVQHTAESALMQVREETVELQQKAAALADEARQTAQDKLEEVKETIHDKVDGVIDTKDSLLNELNEKKDTITDKLKDELAQLQHTAATLKEQAITKTGEMSTELKENLDEKSDKLQEIGENAKLDAEKTKQSLLERAETAVLTGAVATHDGPDNAKDKLSALVDQGKAVVSEKLEALDEKTHAKQKLDELSEKTTLATELVKEEVSELKNNAEDAINQAKQAGESYSQTHATQGVAAKLGMMGAYLSGLYAGGHQNKQFSGVNLMAEQFEKDAFHTQSSGLFTHILGQKGATAQSLVGKVVPQHKLEALSETIYNKVATWAANWADKDLKKDPRFVQLAELNDNERDAFAQEIADQNRALATIGGVAGFAGLKGLVADMAWLLLVSLRTVYQLAAIYDKPLKGEVGIKQAYGVLGGANLEKMQEKQVILTALALGNTMLANAKTTGLKNELGRMTSRFQESQLYTDQIEQLGRYVDLDKFNPSWLAKLLPVASVATGAYYNNELISEVIGTAMATFANQKTLNVNQQAKQYDEIDFDSANTSA